MAQGIYRYGEQAVMKKTATGAATPGDVELHGNRIAVVLGSQPVVTGDEYGVATRGVFELDILSTDTPADGALLYWDAGNSRLTTTSSTHKSAGLAVGAKASGVTRQLVDINASVASATI